MMSPDQPSAWSIYIGSDDVDALGQQITAAGGKVIAPAFDVGDQGRMAVFQDPSGAFISAWQATRMRGFQTEGANAFGWAEVNARGVDKVVPFYQRGLRLDAQDDRLARAAVHRVPGRRRRASAGRPR